MNSSNNDFNPRAPCGARLSRGPVLDSTPLFQSTRPVWGATIESSFKARHIHNFNPRAPCGARRGFRTPRCRMGLNFNPRAPCGARPGLVLMLAPSIAISIHAPRVGRDLHIHAILLFHTISIHAPRVGRDHVRFAAHRSLQHFNPRAPCGARLYVSQTLTDEQKFQSTRPVWGATKESCPPIPYNKISIHAPRVGRDLPSD